MFWRGNKKALTLNMLWSISDSWLRFKSGSQDIKQLKKLTDVSWDQQKQVPLHKNQKYLTMYLFFMVE